MRAALIVGLGLAAVSAAPAAAWEEVPFRPLPGDEVATCLRATGPEGGLAALGLVGRRSTPTDLLAIGAGAPAVRERLRFRVVRGCAAVREQGGAGVAAAQVSPLGKRRGEMRAAVRDPGGVFGAPAALGPSSGPYDAAVSSRADAVVAWVQERGSDARVVVARRAPGQPFGPPVGLTPWRRTAQAAPPEIAAGIDRDGMATVVWALRSGGSREYAGLLTVEAASAPPGAAFGPPQRLTRRTREVERISLAVAAGGAALVAHEGDQHIRLFERAPGAGGFGPAREIGDASAQTSDPAPALRDDGAAVVAWHGGAEDDAVRAMTRARGGAFGPDREAAPGSPNVGFGTGFSAFFVPARDRAFAPLDPPGLGLRAVIAATGRVVLAWTAPRALPDAPLAPVVATGTLDGVFGPPATLGSPARSVGGVAALVLPGGEPAVAWADNTAHPIGFGAGELEPPAGAGRIHLARADAAAGPAAPPPAARLRAPRLQRLYPEDPIRVSVRCVAACDVRAFIPEDGATSAGTAASLESGRSKVLRLYPTGGGGEDGALPRRRGRVTVRARVSAPGSLATRTVRLRVRLAQRPPLPVPLPLDARAVRRGRAIVVTWRTAFPARRVEFNVAVPAAAGTPNFGEPAAASGRGRTRFRLTLRPRRPGTVHRVVIAASDLKGLHGRKVTVPVTG